MHPELWFLCFPLLFVACTTVKAGLSVESWELLCLVHDPGSPGDPNDGVAFQTVQNPFVATHTATLGPSSCETAYDLGWVADTAHFDVFPTHYLEELDGRTVSEGRIILRPAVDSLITLSGTWQYAWPSAAIGSTDMLLGVYDNIEGGRIVSGTDSGGNLGVGPPFGTLTVNKSGLLPAGGEYLIAYSVQILHFDPTPPGTYGEGSGEIQFTITPVPEPAACALLLPALLFATRRALPVADER